MSGITRIFQLLREQFRFEKRICRMWLGIGMGVAPFFFSVQQFMEFVQLRAEPANILDGFLYSLTDPQSSMLIVLGYLFLLSDAPFVNERTLQLAIRISRKIWNSICIMYIGLLAFFYYGTILLLSMLLSWDEIFIGNMGSFVCALFWLYCKKNVESEMVTTVLCFSCGKWKLLSVSGACCCNCAYILY